MPEDRPPEPPTFFANIATIHVNVDEVSIEFRRVLLPHGMIWRVSQGKEPTLPTSDEELYKFPPTAKVVLTFLAAKALRDNLNTLLPAFEEQRKKGA
jgi:hypothetical protein